MRYSLGERRGSARAEGWSGWLLTSPIILWRPEPFGTRSRATAMASLPMFAMHVWSEPSHVVVVACFPGNAHAHLLRVAWQVAGASKRLQRPTILHPLARLGAQGAALKAVFKEIDRVRWTPPIENGSVQYYMEE